MSTDVESRNETRTPPPGPGEQTLQGITAQAARLGLPQLQFNADYLLSSLLPDVPFDATPYTTLSREELGLGLSSFWDQFDTNRRERILGGLRDRGVDPHNQAVTADLQGDELRAVRELQEEDAAKQQYIQQARQRYEAVRQTPLAKLTQSQIEQATRLLPEQQKAESALLGQTVAQSNLAKQYADTVAPLQLAQSRLASQYGLNFLPGQAQAARLGLDLASEFTPGAYAAAQNYLDRSGTAANAAFDAEGRLRADLTDLVTSGRVASPAQQEKIDALYRNQLAQVESDLQRQREDAVRTIPDIATGRGLRLTSADMPDRWNLIGREYLRSANQAALGLASEAARQSLDYPLQTAGLGLQQQYLTGQQTQRVPQGVQLQPGAGLYPALQTSVAFGQNAQSQFPGYLNPNNIQNLSQGTNAYNPFSLPLGLQGSVIGGSPFALQAQNPLLQSRLSNTQSTGFQTTGGILPALQGVGGILSGVGGLAGGIGKIREGFCWIAIALYRENSWKVPLLRWFIGGPLSATEHGQRFADWYSQHGQAVADEIRQNHERESAWRSGFDGLVSHALTVWKYSAAIPV